MIRPTDVMEVSFIAKSLLWFFLLLISLSIHEWGHAFVADKLGDVTPRRLGRVTLNPFAHADLLGTIIFPLLCIFMSSGILFGWGRPVPIDPRNFKRQELYTILAGSAGFLGNLLLCLIGSLVLILGQKYYLIGYSLLELNALLIALNLLPIPGLDGFYLVRYLTKMSDATVEFLSHWGFFILLVLINVPVFRALLSFFIQKIVVFFLQISVFVNGLFV